MPIDVNAVVGRQTLVGILILVLGSGSGSGSVSSVLLWSSFLSVVVFSLSFIYDFPLAYNAAVILVCHSTKYICAFCSRALPDCDWAVAISVTPSLRGIMVECAISGTGKKKSCRSCVDVDSRVYGGGNQCPLFWDEQSRTGSIPLMRTGIVFSPLPRVGLVSIYISIP